MLYRFRHQIASAVAASMIVTCLPLGSVVMADSPSEFYYVYQDGEAVLIGEELPQGAEKMGVIVVGGDYTADEDDHILIANNANIDISNIEFDPENYTYELAGKSQITTSNVEIISNDEAYEGEYTYEALSDYFFSEPHLYDYYVTGELDLYSYAEMHLLVIEENAVFNAYSDFYSEAIMITYGEFNICPRHEITESEEELEIGSTVYCDCILSYGTLNIEGISEGMIGCNSLDISGNSLLCNTGTYIVSGGDGAVIRTENGDVQLDAATVFYDYDEHGVLNPVAMLSQYTSYIYDSSESRWMPGQPGIQKDHYSVEYAEYIYDDGGRALVTAGDTRVISGRHYEYDANENVILNVIPPFERADETPMFRVTTADGSTALYVGAEREGSDVTFIGKLADKVVYDGINEVDPGIYEFRYDPADDLGFDIEIIWSEFDAQVPWNVRCIDIDCAGSVVYEMRDADCFATDPNNPNHRRYFFIDEYPEVQELYVASLDDHDVMQVMLNGEWYQFDQEHIINLPEPLSVLQNSDGINPSACNPQPEEGRELNLVYSTQINVSSFEEYNEIFLCIEADDVYHDDPVQLADNEFTVRYDNCDFDGEGPQAFVLKGLGDQQMVVESDAVYSFETGEEITFVLIPPENRRENCVPVVRIDRFEESLSSLDDDIEVTEIEGAPGFFEFTFTPDRDEGFFIEIYWCEFDAFCPNDGDIMVELSFDQERGSFTLDDGVNPDGFMTDPTGAGHHRMLFTSGNIPENGININVSASEENFIDTIWIENRDYRIGIVPDGAELSEEDDRVHASDCEFASETDGILTVTVPSDYDDQWFNIRIDFGGNGGPGPQFDDGQFTVEYDSRPNPDGDPTAWVEIDGSFVDDRYTGEIVVDQEMTFTLLPPENRIGAEPVIRIEAYDHSFEYSTDTDDVDRHISVINNSFTFTPTSDTSFVVRVDWCLYDATWPHDDEFMIECNSAGSGNINVSDVFGSVSDPSGNGDTRYILQNDVFEQGDNIVTIGFTPADGYHLDCIYVSVGRNESVRYVPDDIPCGEGDVHISENDAFTIDPQTGEIVYTLTSVPGDEFENTIRFRAEYVQDDVPPVPETGEIFVNSFDETVEYAFVNGEDVSEFIPYTETIIIDPSENDPDQIILRFSVEGEQELRPVSISGNYMGNEYVPEVRRVDENNCITLDRGEGWGSYIVDLAGWGSVVNYEFRINGIGNTDNMPIAGDDYTYGSIYNYEIGTPISFSFAGDAPYKVVVYPNMGAEQEITPDASGIYTYDPQMISGFEIRVFETQNEYDFFYFNAGEGEMQFEYNVNYSEYPEAETPSSTVSFIADNARFMTSGNRTSVILDDETETFELTVSAGQECREYQVILDGQDITASVIENDNVITIDKDNIVRGMQLNIIFFHIREYAIQANPVQDGGSYTVAESAYEGSVVSINPIPANGYELDSIVVTDFGESDVPVTEQNTFVMPSNNVSVTVTFKKTDYTITTAQTQNGTVTVAQGAQYGDNVTITLDPATGYELDTLTVTDSESHAITVTNNAFTMPADNVTVTATFKKIDYTITAAQAQNGTVTVAQSAQYGDNVTITLAPATGYVLDTLTVTDSESHEITVTDNAFTMPADNVTVTATFKKIDYTITTAQTQNGTVTVAQGAQYGDNVTITLAPATGYELDTLTVTDSASHEITVTNNAFTMPADNITVTATFKASDYSVVLTCDTTMVTVSGIQSSTTAHYGDQYDFTVTALEGFEIISVTADGVELVADSDSIYHVSQPAGTLTVVVTAQEIEILNGWVNTEDGTYYYIDNVMQTGWLLLDSVWYYFDADGLMVAGEARTIGGKIYVFGDDGVMASNGWKKLGDDWYYLTAGGAAMVNSWISSGSNWYYMGADGVMLTNTAEKIGNKTYVFNASGIMLKNTWTQVDGNWYYLMGDGSAKTEGWVASGSNWYYMDADGVMVTNTAVTVNGKIYVFAASGVMLKDGWQKVDGNWYYLNSDGSAKADSWLSYNDNWYYLDSDGVMVSNTAKTIGGKLYVFNASGVMLKSGWRQLNGDWYFLDGLGVAKVGRWQASGGYWYYLGADGVMVSDTSVEVNGTVYEFDADGRCLNP